MKNKNDIGGQSPAALKVKEGSKEISFDYGDEFTVTEYPDHVEVRILRWNDEKESWETKDVVTGTYASLEKVFRFLKYAQECGVQGSWNVSPYFVPKRWNSLSPHEEEEIRKMGDIPVISP